MRNRSKMAAKSPDYNQAVAYWSSQPTTVDGMLGGYGTGRVPRLDITHSQLFLNQLISAGHLPSATANITVDCGAGIGRVTANLLLQVSEIVDLVEPCIPFTEEIKHGELLKDARTKTKQIGQVYEVGLQDWQPALQYYNIIWNQWCLGQLSNTDLVAYLKRCKAAIKRPGGLVFVKENIASGSEDVFDDQDSSWTRSEESFMAVFKQSGLTVVKSSAQHGFPKELYKVKLWAMR